MEKYGRLTVVAFFMKKASNGTKRYAHCICDCGKETDVYYYGLKKGYTKSCGCLAKELFLKRATTHGQCKSRLYIIWYSMKRRCSSPKAHNYKYYGGRGISVCKEWERFEPFQEWALSSGYNEKMTIDRLDSYKNYCPENCQWLTKSQNTLRANEEKRKNRALNNLI